MNQRNFCKVCGARLAPDGRFCESCGSAVDRVNDVRSEVTPAAAVPAPPPGSMPPPAQPLGKGAKRGSFPWLVVGLLGVVGLACLVLVVLGGLYVASSGKLGPSLPLLAGRQETALPAAQTIETPTPEMVVTNTALPVTPTIAQPPDPTPTQSPTQTSLPSPSAVLPTETPAFSANQWMNDYSFADDFSSPVFSWDQYADEIAELGISNENYFVQVNDTEYIVWSFLPVDFQPTDIEFDVFGQTGEITGTYGVMCQVQDTQNFYLVEIDPRDRTYIIQKSLNDEMLRLTDWKSAAAFLSPDHQQVNRIGVTCMLDFITLWINNQWVDEVTVADPFRDEGRMGLFVWTGDWVQPEGFRMFFDNVSAWYPVQ